MKFFGKELKFNENKIYHAGDKPTPSEIGAAAASHGTHVTWATAVPKANGTAAIGTVARVAKEDHVHPLQTTVSGNAGTATKLATARTITLKGSANGSVSFDGSGNVTINTSSAIFKSAGTSGTSGYVAFAQIVVTANYVNRPIEFKLISRGRATACTVSIAFANTNNTDPGLSSLTYWGSDYGVFAHKTATSTWLLYCTKSEAYDEITLVGHDYATQGVTVTYPGSFITAKPTTNVTNASIGGNFGHSNTANSATKSTQDSAGQQINTTYIKGLSVSGRVITYTKGDGTTGTITTQDTDTNTTYTANTGIKLNGTTFQHTNAVTAGTAQGDANKTLTWGGTFTIPTVTYDAQGHITGKGTTTMTMPANPNSDTKVTNTLNTTAKAYITGTTSASTNTGTQVFDTGVYLDTTAGMLTATTFKGALSGNASTATKLATARTIALSGIVKGSASFDGSGNVTISVSANDITTITKSLAVTTSWMDTGITGTNLTTGTYAVQMLVNDSTNTSQYNEHYSGIMSWFNGTTNSADADEILLHKAGHASNGKHVYLRTIRTTSSGYLKLQICSSSAFAAASSITFKFKKLI